MTARLQGSTVKFGNTEPPLTIDDAASDERIRAAYARFILNQADESAEPETLLVVLRLLPPRGPRRTWHVRELSERMLSKQPDGTWLPSGM